MITFIPSANSTSVSILVGNILHVVKNVHIPQEYFEYDFRTFGLQIEASCVMWSSQNCFCRFSNELNAYQLFDRRGNFLSEGKYALSACRYKSITFIAVSEGGKIVIYYGDGTTITPIFNLDVSAVYKMHCVSEKEVVITTNNGCYHAEFLQSEIDEIEPLWHVESIDSLDNTATIRSLLTRTLNDRKYWICVTPKEISIFLKTLKVRSIEMKSVIRNAVVCGDDVFCLLDSGKVMRKSLSTKNADRFTLDHITANDIAILNNFIFISDIVNGKVVVFNNSMIKLGSIKVTHS
ncbi:hypothetical protein PCE1_004904 [Barthelona sp. PCE]